MRGRTLVFQTAVSVVCLASGFEQSDLAPVKVKFRSLTDDEIEQDYEANTGRVIVERFKKIPPLTCPGVIVASHGPYAWGQSVAKAVENAAVLETLARMANETLRINSSANTRAQTNVEPSRLQRLQKANAPILQTQMKRGAEKVFKWVTTLYPTMGLAMEAEMGLHEFEDLFIAYGHGVLLFPEYPTCASRRERPG